MYRVGVIGHFGIGLDLANGQTIKTKIVTEAIEKNTKESAILVDAHGGVKAVVSVIIGCITSLAKCKNIVLMLTENGLKVSVPVLTLFNKIFKKRLHYVVIGGWLPKFLNSQPILERQLKSFHCIYVETNTMKNALEAKGFTNVVVMANCKELTILNENDLIYSDTEPLKICTFSRVMKEKGIEDLVDAVREINVEQIRYTLDIYGQIDNQQTEWFENLKTRFTSEINYGGVIPFDKSVETLKKYYMLVFPTLFFTEGIPGTIIDGYAAGIPVLSSKWESFEDVVDDGNTGVGYDFGDIEALKKALVDCAEKKAQINLLKTKCLLKSKQFTIECAMKVLFDNLA